MPTSTRTNSKITRKTCNRLAKSIKSWAHDNLVDTPQFKKLHKKSLLKVVCQAKKKNDVGLGCELSVKVHVQGHPHNKNKKLTSVKILHDNNRILQK
eukprot:scaffold12778_cov35-Attheya_sp.AAC.1